MDDLKPNHYSSLALENKKSFWVFLGCKNKIQSSTGARRTGKFCWQTRVPDWKKICRLTEQQWKKEEEEKELKEIPEEETKDLRRVLKRRRNETNKRTDESTYISTIIEKCRSELQRRKTETMDIPKIVGNIDETKPNPE